MTSQPATGLTPGAQAPAAQDRPSREAPGSTFPGPASPAPAPAASGTATDDLPTAVIAAPGASPTSGAAPAAAPLAGDIPAERHRLSRRVTRYWRWRILFGALPFLLLLISLAIVIPWGPWWFRWGIVGIAFALIVIGMIFLPPIRYRVFWYAISPTEVDIQHGIIFIKRSVVPMHRVQNLRTERGPMADHYRMSTLKIRTAAGSVTISGLDRVEANELCDRISRLSDVADDV